MPKYKVRTKDCRLIVKAKASSKEKINERELDFFVRKNVRGLLKATYIRKLTFKGIVYTGPIGIDLDVRLKKPVTKYDFFFIVEQIVDLVQKLKTESLCVDKIDWNIKNVYINETTREMQFIYYPIEVAKQPADIIGFIEQIIYLANFTRDDKTDYISEFTYFIKGMKEFDPDQVEKYILRQEPGIVNTLKKLGAGQSGFMTDKPRDYYAHYEEDDEATGLLNQEDEATGLLVEDDPGTTLLEEEGTTLLQESAPMHYPTLVRISTNETIEINKPVFRMGKERSYSDYFISDNTAVSRSHADIITRGRDYYVTDLNSKNRTYLNDQQLSPQEERQIKNGDRLRLANEDFIFYE